MKQLTFIVEVVIKDDKPQFITRESRTGQIVKLSDSTKDLLSFFDEISAKLINTKVTDNV